MRFQPCQAAAFSWPRGLAHGFVDLYIIAVISRASQLAPDSNKTMSDQQEWLQAGAEGLPFDLYPASLDEGALRAKNEPGEVEREVITDRSPGSPYKVQAILRTCIHGTLTKGGPPASLIVVDYRLQIAKEGARFSKVTTSFKFASHGQGLSPSVIAYSPFEQQLRWNHTQVTKTSDTSLEAEFSPEVQGINVGSLTASRESGSEWVQRSFDRGLGTRHYTNDRPRRAHIVEWTLLANKRQREGVAPSFRVAMLVAREGNGQFEAKFTISAHGGFGYVLEHLKDRFLRKTAIDDPIIFSPSREPFGDTLEGVVIDRNNLQALVTGSELKGLSTVWGLDPLPVSTT